MINKNDIPSEVARLARFFCLICEADAMSDKTSLEDKACDTGGRLCKALSTPLVKIAGILFTSIFHEHQCRFQIKTVQHATHVYEARPFQ